MCLCFIIDDNIILLLLLLLFVMSFLTAVRYLFLGSIISILIHKNKIHLHYLLALGIILRNPKNEKLTMREMRRVVCRPCDDTSSFKFQLKYYSANYYHVVLPRTISHTLPLYRLSFAKRQV
jgi:hypothetical protein